MLQDINLVRRITRYLHFKALRTIYMCQHTKTAEAIRQLNTFQ